MLFWASHYLARKCSIFKNWFKLDIQDSMIKLIFSFPNSYFTTQVYFHILKAKNIAKKEKKAIYVCISSSAKQILWFNFLINCLLCSHNTSLLLFLFLITMLDVGKSLKDNMMNTYILITQNKIWSIKNIFRWFIMCSALI